VRFVGHLREFLATWSFDPVLFVVLGIVAATYLGAGRAISARHPTQPWQRRHTVLFLTGLGVVVMAMLGPVGSLDEEFFWAHMTQHILLMMLAAPLLLLGEPILMVLRVASPRQRRVVVVPALRSQVVRFLTNPAVSWVIFAGVLVGTHLTGFYEYSLEHSNVHNYVEHPLYLGAGLLYFYPLLGMGTGASRMQPFSKVVSLFLMMVPETALGFGIYTVSYVLYPYYLSVGDRPWGPSTALIDQRVGGAIMWSSGMIFNAVWISIAVWEWIKSEDIKARRIDAAIASERLAGSS
jgi:cytochrome c oxidase assembly factor CtaG